MGLLQLEKQRREFIEEYDRVAPYVDEMVERDIEKYRKMVNKMIAQKKL